MNEVVYAEGPPELHSSGVTAESFSALADIALADLGNQGPSGMVCGPISTGGTGHQVLNLEIFNATIKGLKDEGKKIFTQIPYEFGLRRLTCEWQSKGHSGYPTPILNEFYARLFASGLIIEGCFIPGWNLPPGPSIGATWERLKLTTHRAIITDLSREDIERFLLKEHTPEHVAKIMSLLPRRTW